MIKSIKSNLLSSSYAQFVSVAVQLVSIPLFLSYWGVELYAEWIVVIGIPAILATLDLSVAQASTSKTIIKLSANDVFGAKRASHTALVFTMFVATFLLLATICAGYLLGDRIVYVIKIEKIASEDVLMIIIAYTANLGLQLMAGVIDGWFKANNNTSLGVFVGANRRLLDLIVTFVFLGLNFTPLQLAGAILMSQLMYFMFWVVLGYKVNKVNLIGVKYFRFSDLKDVIPPGIAYASFSVSQALLMQGGVLILNQIGSSHQVVGYVMVRTYMRLIVQLGSVVNLSVRPELSRAIGLGKDDELVALLNKHTVNFLVLSLCAYFIMAIAGPSVIDWWSVKKVATSSYEFLLIGLHCVLYTGWYFMSTMLMASNAHGGLSKVYLFATLFSVGLYFNFAEFFTPVVGFALFMLLPELAAFIFALGKNGYVKR